jgi:hypothetical protein
MECQQTLLFLEHFADEDANENIIGFFRAKINAAL